MRALAKFSRGATESEFCDFVVNLRKRATRNGDTDYMFTIPPAVRVFVRRFPGTDGRALVATMELLRSGEDEEALAHFETIKDRSPYVIQLLVLLRPSKSFLRLGEGVAWEANLVNTLLENRPNDPLLERARAALTETRIPIREPAHERLWNDLYQRLYADYEKSFEGLVRGAPIP
jgi:hypothetical protein